MTGFNCGSKGIWDCIGFTLFRLVIGLKKTRATKQMQDQLFVGRPRLRAPQAVFLFEFYVT